MSQSIIDAWRNQPNSVIALELIKVLRSKFFQLQSDFSAITPLLQWFNLCTAYDADDGFSVYTIPFSAGYAYSGSNFMIAFDTALRRCQLNYLDINVYAPESDWTALSGIDWSSAYLDDSSSGSYGYRADPESLISYLGETYYDSTEDMSPKYFFPWAMQRLRMMSCLEIMVPFRHNSGANHDYVSESELCNAVICASESSRYWNAVSQSYVYSAGRVGRFLIDGYSYGTKVNWYQPGFMAVPHDTTASGDDQQTFTAYLYGVSTQVSTTTSYQETYAGTAWVYGHEKLSYLNTLTLTRDNATSRILEFDDPDFQAYYPDDLLAAGCGEYGTDRETFQAYCDILFIPPHEQMGSLEDYPTFTESQS